MIHVNYYRPGQLERTEDKIARQDKPRDASTVATSTGEALDSSDAKTPKSPYAKDTNDIENVSYYLDITNKFRDLSSSRHIDCGTDWQHDPNVNDYIEDHCYNKDTEDQFRPPMKPSSPCRRAYL